MSDCLPSRKRHHYVDSEGKDHKRCLCCGKLRSEAEIKLAKYYRQYYAKNKQKVQERQRQYQKTHGDQIKEYRRTHRAQYNEYNRKYHASHKEMMRANYLAYYWTTLGRICVKCGSTENLGRHHPDYSKPLEIVTFCHTCNMNERGPGEELKKKLLQIEEL